MPLLIAEQRTPEWLEAHRGRITSSTGAAVLGRHPDHGPLWAFRHIMGQHKEASGNPWMDWGIQQEGTARAAYEVATGNLVTETGLWTHDCLPWLGASPDGLIGRDGMLEIKCLKHRPEAIPDHYLCQMQIQLAVCGREWCDFFTWHPDWTFLARVHRDVAQETAMLCQLDQWYNAHIKANVEPPRRRKKGMGAACNNIPVAVAERIINNLGASVYDERLNLDPETPSDGMVEKGA